MKFTDRANEASKRFLTTRGYDILDEAYTCEAGTIDFVAEDEGTVVFVEVNARKDSSKGFLPSPNPKRSASDSRR